MSLLLNRNCNYHIRALRHIWSALSDDTAIIIGRAIVLSRIDYCNALLSGTSEAKLERLQRLQKRLIRVVKRFKFRASTTSARSQLHWLPVQEHITFKLDTLTYNALNIQQTAYIAELLSGREVGTLCSTADRTLLVIPRTGLFEAVVLSNTQLQ